MKSILFSVFSSCLALSSASASQDTVDYVDLSRYVGQWYELASIPQSFQKKCTGNVTAEYTALPDGKISVTNSCNTISGERSVALGQAKIVNDITNAELKVTFVKFFGKWIYAFGGAYNVIDLEPNYNFAVVGHPDKTYGWILSRSPQLSPKDWMDIAARLEAKGYDLKAFLTTSQAGGLSSRINLETYIQNLRNGKN